MSRGKERGKFLGSLGGDNGMKGKDPKNNPDPKPVNPDPKDPKNDPKNDPADPKGSPGDDPGQPKNLMEKLLAQFKSDLETVKGDLAAQKKEKEELKKRVEEAEAENKALNDQLEALKATHGPNEYQRVKALMEKGEEEPVGFKELYAIETDDCGWVFSELKTDLEVFADDEHKIVRRKVFVYADGHISDEPIDARRAKILVNLARQGRKK